MTTQLLADVEVLFDSWGAAHIYAGNAYDASYVQCYLAARDRLYQMDYRRHDVMGKLAEWFGPDELDHDRSRKLIGLPDMSAQTWRWLEQERPETARRIRSCVAGSNQYLADIRDGRNGARLPKPFGLIDPDYFPEDFVPEEVVALGKGLALGLSFSADTEILNWLVKGLLEPQVYRDLIRYEPFEDAFILQSDEVGYLGMAAEFVPMGAHLYGSEASGLDLVPEQAHELVRRIARMKMGPQYSWKGSNNWIVHGSKTVNGYPLIANDPHLSLPLAPNFYDTHLIYPVDGREINVQGIMFAGGPGVLIGHNDDIGWGITTTMGDVTDVYREELSVDGRRYRTPQGDWADVIVRSAEICVRLSGRPVSECEPEYFEWREIPGHGPLFNDSMGALGAALPPMSMRWAGRGPTGELDSVTGINMATSLDQAKQALASFNAGQQNWVIADTEGSIGYFAPSYLPVRRWNLEQYPPYLPIPVGPEFEWDGFRDYTDVPQVTNPQRGFIVSANNDPLGTTLDNNPQNDGYYLGAVYDFGARAKRISDRLESAIAETGVTFDIMRSIQTDVHSVLADRFLPYLLAVSESEGGCTAGSTDDVCSAYGILAKWDRENELGQVAPTLFIIWFAQFLIDTFADELVIADLLFGELGDAATNIFARSAIKMLRGESLGSRTDYFDNVRTVVPETGAQILHQSLVRTVEHGRRAFRETDGSPSPITTWILDRKHKLHLEFPGFSQFTYGPIPFRGGQFNVDESSVGEYDGASVAFDPMLQGYGPNMTMVMEVKKGSWITENAIPGGVSGDPDSPHFTDQLTELYLQEKTRRLPYYRSDVESVSTERWLFPAGFGGPNLAIDRP